ncbi:hypothetical protein [Bradyrhizobium sp.]|uniref:hypothetical protein n=1 Tax=Bradyrhizobium sp. TaxID=376 RepID=UPI003C671EDD
MQRLLDGKQLVNRMPAILLGYFCACLTAGPILITADLWWQIISRGLDPEFLLLPLYALVIYSGALLLPVLIVAVICEFLRVQRLAMYLVLGGLCLLLAASVVFGNLLEHVTVAAIITGAGLAAGLVYWLIAGRNAGIGKRASPKDQM